jgi:hypothetical protein
MRQVRLHRVQEEINTFTFHYFILKSIDIRAVRRHFYVHPDELRSYVFDNCSEIRKGGASMVMYGDKKYVRTQRVCDRIRYKRRAKKFPMRKHAAAGLPQQPPQSGSAACQRRCQASGDRRDHLLLRQDHQELDQNMAQGKAFPPWSRRVGVQRTPTILICIYVAITIITV